MLAVIEAKQLIESASFTEINEVYTVNLPEEVVSNTDKTIVLITEAKPELTTQGNNDFYGIKRLCEIQLFYKLDVDFNIEDFEIRLMKLFTKNHWSVIDIRERAFDPDTQQITGVFYVSQDKILN